MKRKTKKSGLTTSKEPFTAIAIDYDDTIANTRYDPKLDLFISTKPKKGVKKALQLFKALQLKIIIFSCRNNALIMGSKKNKKIALKEIQTFMEKHDLPYDEIDEGLNGKPLAMIYIDDRGVAFKNNWKEISKQVKNSVNKIMSVNKKKFKD